MDNPHYVTPRDAEISYCPMSMGGHEGKDLCVGPQCMAWRWGKKEKQSNMKIVEYFDNETRINIEYEYSTTHGYCGMVKL